MKRLLLLTAFFISAFHPIRMQAQQTLASYLNLKRVLLIFAPSDKDPIYQQQLTQLQHHHAELVQRDLVILPVVLQQGPPVTPDTLRVILGPGLPDQEQILARRRFHIEPTEFTVILIGKDGDEKFRSQQPVAMQKLDQLIDAMPMRQDEMRNPR